MWDDGEAFERNELVVLLDNFAACERNNTILSLLCSIVPVNNCTQFCFTRVLIDRNNCSQTVFIFFIRFINLTLFRVTPCIILLQFLRVSRNQTIWMSSLLAITIWPKNANDLEKNFFIRFVSSISSSYVRNDFRIVANREDGLKHPVSLSLSL